MTRVDPPGDLIRLLADWLLAQTGEPGAAEDIHRSVLEKLRDALPVLRWEGPVESWVLQIARTRTADWFRRGFPASASASAPEDPGRSRDDAAADAAEAAMLSALRPLAETAGDLPGRVVLLVDYEGLALGVVCRDLGIERHRAADALDRGRERLRRCLHERVLAEVPGARGDDRE